jgi:acetyltransferase-like isoleucine patch superfamily enzyme
MVKSSYKKLKERFPRPASIVRRIFRRKSAEVQKSIHGQDNFFKADGAALSAVRVDIIGNNNLITIGAGCVLSNVHFRLRGSGHRIEFGENCRISRGAVLWFEDRDGFLEVGSGTTMVEVHIAVTERSGVHIGEDCMLANDIDIRTGDSHSVIDVQTNQRLNHAAEVTLDRHVWIAPHTVILKGVHIGENSIIGTGAVVTKSCESGVIMAGNPAKVIKTGISWKRERG